MSSHGGGGGPYGAQPQQHQHQPQHQRGLASVGSASSLFDDDGAHAGGDLFDLGSAPTQHQQQQQQRRPSVPQNNSYGAIDTVIEEDEPDSPDLNRYGRSFAGARHQPLQQHQQQQQHQQYQQGGYEYDDQYGQQQQQGGGAYEQAFEPPYYPGFVYDAATNSYLPDPNAAAQANANESWDQQAQQDLYGQHQQPQGGEYDYSNQQYGGDYGAYDQQQQQQQQQQAAEAAGGEHDEQPFEPPYYPGFIYDAASNSYLPDPNAQSVANETWDHGDGTDGTGTDAQAWDGQQQQQQQYLDQQGGDSQSYDHHQHLQQQPSDEFEPTAAPATNEETTNWDDYSSSPAPPETSTQEQGQDQQQQQQQQHQSGHEDWSLYEQRDDGDVFGPNGNDAYEQQGYSYDDQDQGLQQSYDDQVPTAETSAPEPEPQPKPAQQAVAAAIPPPKASAKAAAAPPATSEAASAQVQPSNDYDAYNEHSYGDGQQPYSADTTWDQAQGEYDSTTWVQQQQQQQQGLGQDAYDSYGQQQQEESWDQSGYDQSYNQSSSYDPYSNQQSHYDAYAPASAAPPAAALPTAEPPRHQQQQQQQAPPPPRAQSKAAPQADPYASRPSQAQPHPSQQEGAPYDPYAPNKPAPKKFSPVHAPALPTGVTSPTLSSYASSFSPPPRSSSRGSTRSTSSSVATAPPKRAGQAVPPPRSSASATAPPSKSSAPPPPKNTTQAVEPLPRPSSDTSNASSSVAPPPRSDSRSSTRSNMSSASALQGHQQTQSRPPATAAPPGRVLSPPPQISNVAPPPRANAVSPPPARSRNAASPPPTGAAPPRTGQRAAVVPSAMQYQSFAAPLDSDQTPTTEAQASQQQQQQQPPQRREPPKPQQPRQREVSPPQQTQVPPSKKEAPAPAPATSSTSTSAAPLLQKKAAGAGASRYEPFNPALAASRKAAASAAPVASRLPPPVQPRRQPHQRGASAFGSDSPYATLPDLPPMPQTASLQASQSIGEEEEEEEIPAPAPAANYYAPPPQQTSTRNAPPPASKQQQKQQPQEEQEEQGEVAPSWMERQQAYAPSWDQASQDPNAQSDQQSKYDNSRAWETSSVSSQTSAPAPPPPSAPKLQQQQDPSMRSPMRGARKAPPRYAAPPVSSAPPASAPPAPPPVRQAPPAAAAAPPPAQSHPGYPPVPKAAGSTAPPPARGQGAPPPPRGQQQGARRPVPSTGGAPPRGPPPSSQPPQQQNARQPPPPPPLQRRHSRPLSDIREGGPEQPIVNVPALKLEAPSPEIRPQEDDDDVDPYAPRPFDEGDSTATERDPSVVEHSYDESADYSQQQQQQQQDYSYDEQSYAPQGGDYDNGAVTPPTSAPSTTEEYGLDDSQVFGDGAMSASTSGSNYGEWTGTSDAQSGYNYVSNGMDSLSLNDPYNPSQAAYDYPQAPSRDSNYTPQSTRATSNYGSPTKATHGQSAYAPPQVNRTGSADPYSKSARQGNAYAPSGQSNYSYAPSQLGQGAPFNAYAAQQQAPQHPGLATQGSYDAAPADLGLDRSTAPIVSFGLGGKLVVAFPGSGQSSYGYGAPSSSGTVHIRKLEDLLALPASATPFPGPLFLDGGKANAGKKRKEAVAWLEARTADLEKEVSYLKGAGPGAFGTDVEGNKRKLEIRLILVKLVKVLVENEGKLMGTPKIDEAVRSILVPHSEAADISDSDLPTASQLAAATAPLTPSATGGDNSIANYVVTEANLDKLSSFLLRGERRKAVQYALDHRLWAHAFVISSCVDTDCWKEVVLAFLQSELTPSIQDSTGGATGREAMRVSYAMFAGLEAESIQQFVPPVPLAPSMMSPKLLPSALPVQFSPTASLSRRSSNAAENALNRNLPESVLSTWQETCAMIVANRALGDSAALSALGDALAANGWIDAAHVCYLLSPATSPIGGPGSPGARLALIGSPTPTSADVSAVDIESIQLTELVEFAFSLPPAVKGQEPFVGFPHLQAYRLYHAMRLADAGQVAQAQRYTDAIIATLKLATKPSPYYTPRLAGEVKAVAERFNAAAGQDKSGSWLGRMVPRGPTKEGLWSTLEGGFTKFVAGDGEPTSASLAAKAEVAKAANGAPVGPFSHYSSISPGSTSGTLSRVASNGELAMGPPSRPHSSAAVVSPTNTHQQMSPQQHSSPGPPPVKRAPFKTHHSRSSSLGVAGYNYDPSAPPPWQSHLTARQPTQNEPDATPRVSAQQFNRTPQNAYGYGAPLDDDSNDGGLRAPVFAQVEQGSFAEDDSGFISPMAAYTPSVSPAPTGTRAYNPTPQAHRRTTTQDELEDLGIGNSKSKKPGFDSIGEGEEEEMGVPASERSADKPAPEANGGKAQDRPSIKATPSRSWLGGWFKRDSPSPVQNGPGPVRAKLGEENSLVYDAELKRWVSRKGGDSGASTPLTTVPPPRASTASPSRSSRARFNTDTPPPMPPMPSRNDTSSAPPPSLSRSQTTSDLRGSAASGTGGRRKPQRYIPVT